MIGLDIGKDNCKAVVREGDSLRLESENLPDGVSQSNGMAGEISSPATLAATLKQLREGRRLKGRDCALVLAPSQVYFRHVTLPPMSASETALNLPYEFRDYIIDGPDTYVYDYAVDQIVRDDEGNPQQMELYAAAASKSTVETYEGILRKAGFRLKTVLPPQMCYLRLMKSHLALNPDLGEGGDIVLVDLGHSDVAITLFHGDKLKSVRTIDMGCEELDFAIADLKGIDIHTANTYKHSNFQDVLDEQACREVCDRFATEVSKVVNFYNFSNPDREIGQLFFLGGGASIKQLTDAISQAISIPAQHITAMLPENLTGNGRPESCALAIAALFEGEMM